ncbi:MAG: hypothetical protein L0Y72_12670 [Gemmataceae bacterium]|nr:hypothetical protein [Gemmataceae bacterium]
MSQQRPFPPAYQAIIALLALGLLGLGVYWWYSYSGLYRWLAELQISFFGAYFAGYTGILTLLIVCIPLIPVVFFLKKLSEPVETIQSAEIVEVPIPLPAQQSTMEKWLHNNAMSFALVAMGIVFVAISVYQLAGALTAGERTPFNCADLEAGVVPPSRWLVLDGRIDLHARQSIVQTDRYGGKDDRGRPKGKYFFPMVSEKWQPGQNVTAFVQCKNDDVDLLKSPFEGTLHKNGLPGPIRTGFEEQGPMPASPHYVLEFRKLPADSAQLSWTMLWLGLGLTGGGVLVFFVQRWWRKPRPIAEPSDD